MLSRIRVWWGLNLIVRQNSSYVIYLFIFVQTFPDELDEEVHRITQKQTFPPEGTIEHLVNWLDNVPRSIFFSVILIVCNVRPCYILQYDLIMCNVLSCDIPQCDLIMCNVLSCDIPQCDLFDRAMFLVLYSSVWFDRVAYNVKCNILQYDPITLLLVFRSLQCYSLYISRQITNPAIQSSIATHVHILNISRQPYTDSLQQAAKHTTPAAVGVHACLLASTCV